MQNDFQPDSANAWQLRLYKKNRPMQDRLKEVEMLLPVQAPSQALSLGGGIGFQSWALQRHGGRWMHGDARETALGALQDLFGEEQAFTLDEQALPFEDDSLDLIVILEGLEGTRDDAAFLKECHRCLKEKGELILCVQHVKKHSMIAWFRRQFGLAPEQKGMRRGGYKLRDLYEISKDGYDIVESRFFSGVFSEWNELWRELACGRSPEEEVTGEQVPDQPELRRLAGRYRLQSLFYALGALSKLFDKLLPFTRNHQLVIKARPRPWIERKAVKLRDGRSIAEAAIQTKIGSAADMMNP